MFNFAVIGRNFVVDRFLEAALLHKEVRLLGVYSRNESSALEFAAKYNAERTYTDLDALGNDSDVDFVYIASPNACHEEQAIKLLNYGKHIICEKPAAPSRESLDRILNVALKNGRVFMEAMMPAHTPAVRKIKELLPEIGQVRRASLSYCQYSSRYDKFKSGIVENAFNPALCNGSLMDIGVYCIHVAVMLFGSPLSVTAESVFLPKSIDGEGSAILRYSDMLADISYSKITDSMLPSQIQGENGSILIDYMSHPTVLTVLHRGGEQFSVDTSSDKPDMYYEIDDFVKQLNGLEMPEFNKYSLDAVSVMDIIRSDTGIDFSVRY